MRRLLMVALVATVLCGCGNNHQTSDNNKKTDTENNETTNNSSNNSSGASGGLKIAFVNVDTLQKQYEFAKRILKDLTQKENEVRADLASRGQNFQNEVASFQRTAGTMTLNNVEQTKKTLTLKQQELESYSRVRQRELMTETDKLSKKLKENIDDFLKRFSDEKGYDLILTKSSANSSVLFGKNKLDVTMEVVKGLNKEYVAGKTGKIDDDKKDDQKKDATKNDK